MKRRRISDIQSEFDADIKKFNAHLRTLESDGVTMRGITLGLTSTDMTALNNYRTAWSTDDTANPGLYDKLKNPTLRLATIPEEVRVFMKEFRTFFQPLLNIMAACRNINPVDRAALNIAPPVTSHTIPTEPITEKCYATVSKIGGGKLKFRCHTTTDSNRAGKPKHANAVEVALRIDKPYIAPDSTENKEVSKVKNVLASADDGTNKSIHTKAAFIIEAGESNTGNILQYYARYVNTVHPNLNGPWTGPYSEVIL